MRTWMYTTFYVLISRVKTRRTPRVVGIEWKKNCSAPALCRVRSDLLFRRMAKTDSEDGRQREVYTRVRVQSLQ